MKQFTSAFVNECWRYVGSSPANPQALDELFQEHENLRERARDLDAMRKSVVDELEGATVEIQRLRKDLENFRERETIHIRPLLTALMQHLLYPSQGENPVGLRNRIERARAFKVDTGVDKEASKGLLEELEASRRQTAEIAARNKSLEEEMARQRAATQQPDEKDRQIAEALVKLEEARQEAATAKQESLDAASYAKSLEGWRTQFYRLTVANKRLLSSVREWEDQTKE
jgi:hypothetical protein